ncbi:ABC transporter substrate-binding protein [Scatolibacter rhodanostii]|uniref:ABC transporter substrate-binding protein n=1 Tax=Scatolibacter rhodanostii TaxID=2014781 RepID=UPI000C0811BB|nr:ABC transporter substrate-binding protein [Scatolibacter rhodanostii]
MNSYFSFSDKVYDVTEKYPELIDVLAANGFENLRNEMMRRTLGKTISLQMALKSKQLNADSFERQLVEAIEQQRPALSTGLVEAKQENGGEVKVKGILPCPIRVPFMEKLEAWFAAQPIQYDYSLQAASMGLDWIEDDLIQNEHKGEEALADVYLSAGFGLFFDRKRMGKYKENGVFSDLTGAKKLNSIFDNDKIDLKDPLHQYSILGVVPAIFMVNKEALGDRTAPKSWADLMRPEFENSIALPVRDLDLFNALLLGIYKEYGEEGIKKLGKAMLSSMHPAQMIKTGTRKAEAKTPAVTVMPYFFTWMAKENGSLIPVWPEDGAIVSPIFLLSKTKTAEKIQPLVDFLFSKEVGEVFAAGGKFPSTHPEVDNQLSAEKTFLWPGWDFIHSHDIGKLLKDLENVFFAVTGGGES